MTTAGSVTVVRVDVDPATDEKVESVVSTDTFFGSDIQVENDGGHVIIRIEGGSAPQIEAELAEGGSRLVGANKDGDLSLLSSDASADPKDVKAAFKDRQDLRKALGSVGKREGTSPTAGNTAEEQEEGATKVLANADVSNADTGVDATKDAEPSKV